MTPNELLEIIYRRRGVKKLIRRPTFTGSLKRRLYNKLQKRRRARRRALQIRR